MKRGKKKVDVSVAEESEAENVTEEVLDWKVPVDITTFEPCGWTPNIGEKFEFTPDALYPKGGLNKLAPSYVASVDSWNPLQVTIHEVVNGCVTTRPWKGESMDLCNLQPLTKQEAFQRIHS